MKDSELTQGQRVTKARNLKKLSQAALAKALDLTPAGLSHIETGKSKLTTGNALKIADILKVNTEWLLSGKGSIEIDPDKYAPAVASKTDITRTFKESLPGGNKSGVNSVTSGFPQNRNGYESRLTAHQIEDYTLLPFIPVSARASFVDRFPDMDYEEMGTFPVYDLDPALKKKGAVVIEVNGDSMEPQLKHKAKVLGVPVDAGDYYYMSGVYAIVYAQQFTIKRIIENTLSREGGEIILKADNGGATVAVPGKAIVSIWKIVRMVDAEIS